MQDWRASTRIKVSRERGRCRGLEGEGREEAQSCGISHGESPVMDSIHRSFSSNVLKYHLMGRESEGLCERKWEKRWEDAITVE